MEMSGRRGGKTMEAEKEIARQIQFGKTAYKIGMDFANGRDRAVNLIKMEGSTAIFEHDGKWACIVVA